MVRHGVTQFDGRPYGRADWRPEMWVCNCKAVTDHEIRDLLESPFINTVEDVGKACGAGTGCGGCRGDIARLCAEAREASVAIRSVDQPRTPHTIAG